MTISNIFWNQVTLSACEGIISQAFSSIGKDFIIVAILYKVLRLSSDSDSSVVLY